MGSCGCVAKRNAQDLLRTNSTNMITISPSNFIMKSDKKFRDLYNIKKKVGEGKKLYDVGSFGEVYICCNRETGILRAVKTIRKMDIGTIERERIMREINILKMLDHPNIVRLYEIYEDTKRYYLVTEYFSLINCRLCTGGELFE